VCWCVLYQREGREEDRQKERQTDKRKSEAESEKKTEREIGWKGKQRYVRRRK
jgi:hypothetical protein